MRCTHEGWLKIWQLEVRKQLDWLFGNLEYETNRRQKIFMMLDIFEADEASLMEIMNGGFLWLLRLALVKQLPHNLYVEKTCLTYYINFVEIFYIEYWHCRWSWWRVLIQALELINITAHQNHQCIVRDSETDLVRLH